MLLPQGANLPCRVGSKGDQGLEGGRFHDPKATALDCPPELRQEKEAHCSQKRTSVSNTKTRWTRECKLRALERMEAAADVTALAAELGCRRELLYLWRR
jgi:hypothetical protein